MIFYNIPKFFIKYTEQNNKHFCFWTHFSWAELKDLTFSMYTKGLFLSNIVHKSVWICVSEHL